MPRRLPAYGPTFAGSGICTGQPLAECTHMEHCVWRKKGPKSRAHCALRATPRVVSYKSPARVAASKAAAKKNPWLRHVKAVLEANPKMAYKDALRLASQSYTKVVRK